MKKRLDTSAITSELSGSSAFFPSYKGPEDREAADAPDSAATGQGTPPPQASKARASRQSDDTTVPRYHATTTPRNHDTVAPRNEAEVYEVVRKAVKQFGKEAATHRFTLEEKNLLADIEYEYKKRGVRTSENEITRIAINYFIEEYRQNGEKSILAKILTLLHS